MSIATEIERLQTAKADIKAAIENKGVTVGNGTIDTYAGKIGEIEVGDYDQGYEDGYNEGNSIYYATSAGSIYRSAIFPENAELTVRFKNTPNDFGNFAFTAINLKALKIISENKTNNSANYVNAFRSVPTLEKLDITEHEAKPNALNWAFLGDINLKSILGKWDLSECAECTLWLSSCSKLENIEFASNTIKISISFVWCPLLTDKSIQSIIDGLADLTGGTAQTLTLHSTVGASLTDEQKAVITAKNWTLVY